MKIRVENKSAVEQYDKNDNRTCFTVYFRFIDDKGGWRDSSNAPMGIVVTIEEFISFTVGQVLELK